LVLESQLSEAGGDLLPHQFQRYFVFISSRYSTLTTSVFLLLKGDSYPSFLFLLLSTGMVGRMFLRNSPGQPESSICRLLGVSKFQGSKISRCFGSLLKWSSFGQMTKLTDAVH